MKSKKIMTHIVAGFPTLKESEKVALLMAKNGIDFIEIQIPFSDPVADGPTIMAANQKALENGTKVEDCFELMRGIREKCGGKMRGTLASQAGMRGILATPKFLFMSYFNILHHYGVERFCRKAAESGCYGLIVPDMPIDEEKYEGYLRACKKYGLKAIQVISPLTDDKRLKKLSNYADGFVYCVSRFGTTGQTVTLNKKLGEYIGRVKKYIKIPVAIGFGISKKEHVKGVHEHAEIAVIGSKIIDLINHGGKNYVHKVEDFLKEIKKAV